MEIYGVPLDLIVVIQKLHTNVTYQMKIGEKKTEIQSTVGVKQGDNLGPILFIILTMNAVAASLNKIWNFDSPDFRWHGIKNDGTIDRQTKPQLKTGTKHSTKGHKFTVNSSFYVDDGAFILLNRADLEAASKLVKKHFRRFGLTIHCGDKRINGGKSKTEIMFIPGRNVTPLPDETADVMLNSHEYFGFCNQFKYLGTTFDSSLDDSIDVKKRIQKANGAYAMMANVLRDPKIEVSLRMRLYTATVLNILLYGCECWALKTADRKKLEACHHRLLRVMLRLTMQEVKDNHITNEMVRTRLGNCYSLTQSMELRRARWLQKLANMPGTRNPRRIFVAWIPKPRPIGRPDQTIKRSYAHTIEKELNLHDSGLQTWIAIAKDHKQWAKQVENGLKLGKGNFSQLKKRAAQ